jgi:hypothetical protein
VLVLLIARQNIKGGTTMIYDGTRRLLARRTLATSFDVVFANDRRVYHGVIPVEPADASNLA